MNKAIVTITIGEKYENMFKRYCRKNWQKYCEKYNYDLIVINHYLDNSNRANERSPAWQKLLILSQEWSKNYDQIVWIDSDILINNKRAKDISLLINKNKVGMVDSYSVPTKELNLIAKERQYKYWSENGTEYIHNLKPHQYYETRGFKGNNFNKVAQTGVFVCSSKYHREIFEKIYYNYEDINKTALWNYEMPAMSYELIKAKMVQWIPIEYNYTVFEIISSFYSFIFDENRLSRQRKVLNFLINKIRMRNNKFLSPLQASCLNQIFENGYFIHFAGCQNWIKEIDKSLIQ